MVHSGRDKADAPPLRIVRDDERPTNLPAVRPPADPEPLKGAVVQRPAAPRVIVGRAVHVITDVATHQRTRTVAKHVGYVVAGATVVAKKLWRSRSTAMYQEAIDAAHARGDNEAALEWEARREAFKRNRQSQRMDLLELPGRIIKGLRNAAIALVGVLIVFGGLLAVADKDARQVATPLRVLAEIAKWVAIVFSVAWGPLVVAAPWIVVVALWNTGRTKATMPAWVLPPDQRRRDEADDPITPSRVVVAFRDLGIPALRNAIKDMGDLGAAMLSPIKIAGCGVEVDVTLPSGVTTEEIQQRRRKLAENLGRHEHEVFITIPTAARTVRLWIADSGALDEPIGPSPLVYETDLTADYKTGRAPWGQDLRGDPALISLYQRHLLITGLSNQGKTMALRALVLWLALDPRPRFYIADLKGDNDWSLFAGLAEVLIEGPTDAHVVAATEMLEWGVGEMNRRLLEPPGTPRDPVFLVVDEAQKAFMCPAKGPDGRPYGGVKATSRYFMAAREIHNQGRAVDVLLWEGTQDPTDQNLPKLVREGAHIRASLVVGTEAQARMALGDKAIDGGAAPHKLRQGLDKGTLVVAGDGVKVPAGQPSITIRTHYIPDEDAARIAERAKKRRRPVATVAVLELEERRDLLDDLNQVIGEEKQKLTRLVELLRDLAPHWAPYEQMTGRALGRALDDAEVRTTNTDNLPRLDPADLRKAIARRAAEAADDTNE